MFVDAGRADNQVLSVMAQNFEPWVVKMMHEGKYFGWLTSDGERVVAGAGLLILDWPPHPLPGPGLHGQHGGSRTSGDLLDHVPVCRLGTARVSARSIPLRFGPWTHSHTR